MNDTVVGPRPSLQELHVPAWITAKVARMTHTALSLGSGAVYARGFTSCVAGAGGCTGGAVGARRVAGQLNSGRRDSLRLTGLVCLFMDNSLSGGQRQSCTLMEWVPQACSHGKGAQHVQMREALMSNT